MNYDGTPADDVLLGDAEADTLTGGAGNDITDGGGGNDLFLYSGSSNGYDVVVGGAGSDTIRAGSDGTVIGLESISGVEYILGGGYQNVVIRGSASDNQLDFAGVYLTGIGTIDAGAGNDFISTNGIIGSVGVVTGGAGKDIIYAASGTSVDGGSGIDILVLDGVQSQYSFNMDTGVVTRLSNGEIVARTTSIETLRFTGGGADQVINRLPTAVVDANSAANEVAEDAAIGTTVGITGSATDPDDDSDSAFTLSYSLVDTFGGRFAIDATTGVVTVGAALDYETATSYKLKVKATDELGGSSQTEFTVTVKNVLEAPSAVSDNNTATDQVAENSVGGTLVGITAKAVLEPKATATYSLADNAGGRFVINATSGVVSVANGAALDFESATSHVITVKITDSNGKSTLKDFTIKVTNVAEKGSWTGTDGDDLFKVADTGAPEDSWLMTGGAGNDSLTGGVSADTLVGGAGDDLLLGEAGNDLFLVGKNAGQDSIVGGTGNDTLQASENDTVIDAHCFTGIEAISAGGFSGVVIRGAEGGKVVDLSGVSLNGISVIEGGSGNDTITGSNGADTIRGGAGQDLLNGGSGNDVFLIDASNALDSIDGGLGTDTVVIGSSQFNVDVTRLANVEKISASGQSEVTLVGTSGDDQASLLGATVVGITHIDLGAGDDTFVGPSTAMTYIGGAGNDTLTGGVGNDIFLVRAGDGFDAVVGAGGTDKILAAGNNVVIGLKSVNSVEEISNNGFSGVSIAGDDGDNLINLGTVTLRGITRIDGGAGKDTIIGSTGADTISGGAGDDTLSGGSGNDLFLTWGRDLDGADHILAGAGTDQLLAMAANIDIQLRSWAQLEKISGNGFAGVSLVGDASANAMNFTGVVLSGIEKIDGQAGNDIITGSAGGDVIVGGADDDKLSGESGNDQFLYWNGQGSDWVSGGAGFDTILAMEDDTQIGLNYLTGVELISSGGRSGVRIVGDDTANKLDFSKTTLSGIEAIDAGAGADVVLGAASNDTIYGGAGTDSISGGKGADTLFGGLDADRLSGDDGNDLLVGGGGQDLLFGGAGNDLFVLSVGDGADSIDGGAGYDTLILNAAEDDTVMLGSFNGIERIVGALNWLSGDDTGNVWDFSKVTLEGILGMKGEGGNDVITGTSLGDLIYGGDGDDKLYGGAENDLLQGDDGNDTLVAGQGDDTVIGGAGNDVMACDAGQDMFLISGLAGYDDINGGDGLDHVIATEADTVIGLRSIKLVEVISSGGFANVRIEGDAGANLFDFSQVELDGIALIDAGGGNDKVIGSDAADTIAGGLGSDQLFGGDGDDKFLFSGTNGGFDTVRGGAGTDRIEAAADDTVIGIAAFSEIEVISDGGFDNVRLQFGANADVVNLSNVTVSGSVVIDLGGGNDVFTGTSAADTVVGGQGTDVLTGGGGADLFVFASGHIANDRITDFTKGADRIDLSLVDADGRTSGDQDFEFLGSAAFSKTAGELRVVISGNETLVMGDINGDGAADFTLRLSGKLMLTADDFLL